MADGRRPDARVRAQQRAARRQAVNRRRRAVAGVAGLILVSLSVYGLVDLAIGSGASPAAGGGGSSSSGAPTACDALKLRGGLVVTRLRSADGSCQNVHRLAVYTCPATPRVPTVTAVSGGVAHQYLGGVLATAVGTPPGGLEALGAAGPLTVYRRPATGAVYVRDHGTLSRWLTAPAAAAGARPSVYFLGDSVMLGAQPWVARDLDGRWAVDFDAHVDRSTPQGLGIVTAHAGHLGEAAVIQLGTNDGGRPGYYVGQVDRILQALRGMPLVVWLTIAHARSYYATDDHLLRSAVARYPNAVVADWAAAATPADVYSDGLHLTPHGGKAMARLAATTLDHWRQAALGTAARACAQRVARAA